MREGGGALAWYKGRSSGRLSLVLGLEVGGEGGYATVLLLLLLAVEMPATAVFQPTDPACSLLQVLLVATSDPHSLPAPLTRTAGGAGCHL